MRKDTSFPKLSRNLVKTFSGSFLSASVMLNCVHLLRPSSPNIRTILVYCSSLSTFSPSSQSFAFALKISHALIWSLLFQLKVGRGICPAIATVFRSGAFCICALFAVFLLCCYGFPFCTSSGPCALLPKRPSSSVISPNYPLQRPYVSWVLNGCGLLPVFSSAPYKGIVNMAAFSPHKGLF